MSALGSSINFVNQTTVVPVNWFQDVNNAIYENEGPIIFNTNPSSGNVYADPFVGNGTQTVFNTSAVPGSLASLHISVGGLVQLPTTDYTWSVGTTTITFVTAPPNGQPILIQYPLALPVGTVDSGNAAFTATGNYPAGSAGKALQARAISVTDAPYNADSTGTTDSTTAWQAAVNYAVPLGIAITYPPGSTFKISSTIVTPASYYGLNIRCAGAHYGSRINCSGLAAGTPAFRVVGVPGTTCNAVIEGLGFDGNSGSWGIEIQGCGGQKIRRCQFALSATGVVFHNYAAGTFTEYCQIDTCDFTAACVQPLHYKITSGNNSFHGSGMVGACTINTSTAGFNLIQIDSGCNVYNAPLHVQVWSLGVSGNVINFAGTAPRPSFYGVLTLERLNGAGTINCAATAALSEIAFAGKLLSNNEFFTMGQMFLCDSVIQLSSGARQLIGAKWRGTQAMTTGSNTITGLPYNMDEGAVLYSINLIGTNYTYRYLVAAHAGNGAIPVTLGNFLASNTAGYGAPTFSLNANNQLVITNASFPASGVSATIEVNQLGQSVYSIFLN